MSADSADYRQIHSTFADSGIFIESGRYRRVDADIGKLIKVQVSFIDGTRHLRDCDQLAVRPDSPEVGAVGAWLRRWSATRARRRRPRR